MLQNYLFLWRIVLFASQFWMSCKMSRALTPSSRFIGIFIANFNCANHERSRFSYSCILNHCHVDCLWFTKAGRQLVTLVAFIERRIVMCPPTPTMVFLVVLANCRPRVQIIEALRVTSATCEVFHSTTRQHRRMVHWQGHARTYTNVVKCVVLITACRFGT